MMVICSQEGIRRRCLVSVGVGRSCGRVVRGVLVRVLGLVLGRFGSAWVVRCRRLVLVRRLACRVQNGARRVGVGASRLVCVLGGFGCRGRVPGSGFVGRGLAVSGVVVLALAWIHPSGLW